MKKVRAGCIPYYIFDSTVFMLFMIPSDPKYGGDKPQIAKGAVEEHETDFKEAAIREAEEELGLIKSNTFDVFKTYAHIQPTKTGVSEFYVFACKILTKENFIDPHFETKETVWLNEYQIKENIRRDQQFLVYNSIRKIKQKEN